MDRKLLMTRDFVWRWLLSWQKYAHINLTEKNITLGF